MKEVLEVAAAIAGLLTAIIPLIARVIDWRKRAARMARRTRRLPHAQRGPSEVVESSVLPAARVRRNAAPEPVVLELAEAPEIDDEPVVDVRGIERARRLVKAPAIALLITGVLGVVFNLFIAGFGFLDEFVTPLTTASQERRDANAVAARPEREREPRNDADERTNTVLGMGTLVILAVPCAMAVWAGVNMIRLRSYWLSVAGSIAIMPGACFCCLVGFPIGIWSLVVLFRPDVSSTFT